MFLGAIALFLLVVAAFVPGVRAPALAVAVVLGALVPEAGLLVIALSIMTLPLLQIGGAISDIRGDEVMMGAVVLGVSARWALRREMPRTGLLAAFGAFVLLAALWMGGRDLLGANVSATEYLFPLVKHVVRFALFLAVVWLVRADPNRGRRLRVALVAGANLGGLLALAQTFFRPIENWVLVAYPSIRGGATRELWGNRAFGAFDGNPNHLGIAMLLGAIVALAASDRAKSPRERMAWLAASLVPIFALVSTGSRADWIICAVLLTVFAVRRLRSFQIALAALIGYSIAVPNAFRLRILVLLNIVDNQVVLGTSLAGKVEMAGGSVRQGGMVNTDNFYLDTFYNFSLFALAAWLVLLAQLGGPMWQGMKRLDEEGGFAFGALLALAVMALASVQGPYFAAARVVEVFWLIMGLGWGMLPEAEATGARELPDRLRRIWAARALKNAA